MTTCAQQFAQILKENGINTIFGIPGGEVLNFMEECRRQDISFILTHHEAAASFMADVTGQITRRPGVCLSTLGPGATNLVSGVANAYLDRSPMLAITGQLSTQVSPYCTHQRIDLTDLFQPVTKATMSLDARNTRRKVQSAITTACQDRMGPVHILLPSDVAGKEDRDDGSAGIISGQTTSPVNEELLQRALSGLSQARHPLAVVGLGINPVTDAQIINQFIERTRIPVMATPKAKGVIPEDSPLFLATASGMAGDSLVMEFLEKVDLILGIGFDPVESDKLWHKDKKILSVDSATTSDGAYAPWLEIVGNIGSTLARIIESYEPRHKWEDKELSSFKNKMRDKLKPEAANSLHGLSPYHVIMRLRELLPLGTVVTSDVGAHKLLLGQLWQSHEPLTFFMSNGFSSMGYGLPAAIAAKLQFPDRDVVSICGDGGFLMMVQELETAVRLQIPLICIVFCDKKLALIDAVQKKRQYPSYGVEFGGVDLAGVAKAFGASGVKVNSFRDLEAAIAQGLKGKMPMVIEVPINSGEYEGKV